jgi:hypothetical protein
MPDIGDFTDLIQSLRLGVTALLAGSGPLLLVVILIPSAIIFTGAFARGRAEAPETREPPQPILAEAVPQSRPANAAEGEDGEEDGAAQEPEVVGVADESRAGADGAGVLRVVGLAALGLLLGGLALLWKVIYTPVALTVAGLSRSSLSTLNPVIGFDTIRTMGVVYWQAMGIYTVIAVVAWVLSFGLSFIPILGGIVIAFIDAYAYLMIGCTLGLAVFKKAPELGLE